MFRLAMVVAGAALALTACGGDSQPVKRAKASPSPDDCIILANGGRKLCDADAVAWCSETDAIRDESQSSGSFELDQATQDSQEECNRIEAVASGESTPTPGADGSCDGYAEGSDGRKRCEAGVSPFR